MIDLEWMAWTLPTAIFFTCIVAMLIGMSVWHAFIPSVERQGFLPIATTRGDRLFIGLLTGAFFHLFWIAVVPWPLWGALAVMLLWIAILLRWG